jgi:D-alanine-D-alanine ligase
VGISRVATAADLPAALDEAARHDRRLVAERAVRAREIEVSVLGNDQPLTSLPGEIVYEAEWYDYATKYGEGQARLVVPAAISPALTAEIRALAAAAYRAIDCAGMARVDFFLEGERVLVNEINTIPGFTSTSGYARMWEATGLDYVALVDRLLELALERHRDKHA